MISASTLEKLDKAGIACFVKRADGSYSFVNHSGNEMLAHLDLLDVFWRDSFDGQSIGISIIDEDPTPEQKKVLELMKTIVTEGGDEVVAQIELLSGQQVIH